MGENESGWTANERKQINDQCDLNDGQSAQSETDSNQNLPRKNRKSIKNRN
jgi:hypothetical protein